MGVDAEVTALHRGGEGTPLLLLHGITGTWRAWLPVIPALERHHLVIAPTLAGHHGGPAFGDGVTPSVASLADTLEELLDEEGIDTAHVAGNSLGGWLAIELGIRGRARSVTGIAPAGAWSDEKHIVAVARQLGLGKTLVTKLGPRLDPLLRRPRGRRLLLASVSSRGERTPYREALAGLEGVANCIAFDDLVASIPGSGGIPVHDEPLPVPVRIAYPAKDRTIPFERFGTPLLERLPGAEHVVLHGVGHVPMWDDPELVSRTILDVTAAVDATGNGSAAGGSPAPDTPDPDNGAPDTPMSDPKIKDLDGAQGRVTTYHWHNDGATHLVFLVHGYGEHVRRYDHVVEALAGKGADVSALDHYGHGASDGERALVEGFDPFVTDLASFVDTITAHHSGLPVIMIGHSMGGVISTLYAQRHGEKLAGLVLSGPVIGGNPEMFGLLDMDPIPEIPIDPAALSRDPAVGEDYASDDLVYHGPFARATLQSFKDAVDVIANGPALSMPVLWIHGEEDPLAPVPVTRGAIEKIGGSQVEEKIYPGARHEIFNETNKDEVLADTTAFIAKVVNG